MISLKRLEEMIASGEEQIKKLEEDANLYLLRRDSFYIIQVSILKTLKFVRDSGD